MVLRWDECIVKIRIKNSGDTEIRAINNISQTGGSWVWPWKMSQVKLPGGKGRWNDSREKVKHALRQGEHRRWGRYCCGLKGKRSCIMEGLLCFAGDIGLRSFHLGELLNGSRKGQVMKRIIYENSHSGRCCVERIGQVPGIFLANNIIFWRVLISSKVCLSLHSYSVRCLVYFHFI